jgi:hypothetical protein
MKSCSRVWKYVFHHIKHMKINKWLNGGLRIIAKSQRVWFAPWDTNKRMFTFSVTWFIFILQRREWLFFLHTTRYINDKIIACVVFYEWKKITLLLGMVALCSCVAANLCLAGPMLRVDCPIFGPLGQSPLPFFSLHPAHTCDYYKHRRH